MMGSRTMIDERRRPLVTSCSLPAKDVAVLLAVEIGRAARHRGDVFVPERVNKLKFSVRALRCQVSGLSVKHFISQCKYFAPHTDYVLE